MVAAVAVFAAVSCNKELSQGNLPEGTVVYSAKADGARAVLNETTKKSEWVANDAITVHDGEKGWKFTTSEAGPHVDFMNSEGFGEYRPVMAIYPAGNYTVDLENKTVTAKISRHQQAQVGTYSANEAIAVAYSEHTLFSFKNATALIKFTMNMDNVSHVYFKGNNSEVLVGDIQIALVDDEVNGQMASVTCLSESDEDKVVECYAYHDENHKYFVRGKTYYIAIAPQNFDNGVTMEIKRDLIEDGVVTGDDTIVVKSTNDPVVTKANNILNVGELGGMSYTTAELVDTLYLKPGLWDVDGAWFAVHFYNKVGGTADVKMTDEDADGIYEVAVPKGAESVIFCRMDPSSATFNWNKVWGQTSNLNIPLAGDDKNCYSMTTYETGEWLTYEEATKEEPAEPWGAVGTFNGWDLPTRTSLEKSSGGWYKLEGFELYKDDEFKFAKDDAIWDTSLGAKNATTVIEEGVELTLVAGGQNLKVSKNGLYTISLNPTEKKVKVECTEEYTDLMVKINVNNKANWSPLYIYLEADGNAITPAEGALVSNNVYAISGDYIGKSLTYKFISESKVSDIANVSITRNGATVSLEETIIKLKFQLNTANAKQWWGNTTKIHVWNTGTSFDTSWPGNTMTSEGNYTWSIVVPSELVGKTINFLVHNGNGWQSSDSKVTISAEGNTVTGSSIGVN